MSSLYTLIYYSTSTEKFNYFLPKNIFQFKELYLIYILFSKQLQRAVWIKGICTYLLTNMLRYGNSKLFAKIKWFWCRIWTEESSKAPLYTVPSLFQNKKKNSFFLEKCYSSGMYSIKGKLSCWRIEGKKTQNITSHFLLLLHK